MGKIIKLQTFQERSVNKTIDRLIKQKDSVGEIFILMRMNTDKADYSWRFLTSTWDHQNELASAVNILRIQTDNMFLGTIIDVEPDD